MNMVTIHPGEFEETKGIGDRPSMPMQVGSVYSSLSEAEAHAGAAIVQLIERDA